jgi:hypothetical protein
MGHKAATGSLLSSADDKPVISTINDPSPPFSLLIRHEGRKMGVKIDRISSPLHYDVGTCVVCLFSGVG